MPLLVGPLLAWLETVLGQWLLRTAIGVYLWNEAKQLIENGINSGQFRDIINNAIVKETYNRTGIVLDPANPLTKNSISNGIGQKIGIPLRDVFDKEMLIEDIAAGIAMRINAEYGTQITTVWPPAVFIPQLENAIIDYVILQLEGQRPTGSTPEPEDEATTP